VAERSNGIPGQGIEKDGAKGVAEIGHKNERCPGRLRCLAEGKKGVDENAVGKEA
jgi:hypothetical protein